MIATLSENALIANPWRLAESVGWTLLHSTWQLGMLGIIIAVLLASQSDPIARYRTAFAGLLLMAATPVVFLAWLLANDVAGEKSIGPLESSRPPISDVAGQPFDGAAAVAYTQMPGSELIAQKPSSDKAALQRADIASGQKSSLDLAGNVATASHGSVVVWLVPIWITGMLVLCIRQIGGWFLAYRVVGRAEVLESDFARDCLTRLKRKMGIKRIVKLIRSEEVHTPMVLGIFRPCLIMPSALMSGLTPDQLTAVFAHELAHLRRNDFLQNLVQTAIETLLFFHPCVWWLSNVIRAERENLCDDLSVGVVGQPICLAEALAAIQAMGMRTKSLPLAQAATGRRSSSTLHRIRRLIGGELIGGQSGQRPETASSPPIVLRAVVAAGLVLGLAAIAPLSMAMQTPKVVAPENESKNDSEANQQDSDVESWEISKLYEPAFLRSYLLDHEALPNPIVVPPVRGVVLDPDGKPVAGARMVSHTPRHWVNLGSDLSLKPHNSGGVKKSRADGTFGLPQRTEAYRVLVVHESGVANVSHEELINADGKITLQKWATVSGTLTLEGEPQPDERIVLYFNTLPWSYSRGGPRLTTTYQTKTDARGKFFFDRVPPLGGMAHNITRSGMLTRGTEFQCISGNETKIELGLGTTFRGKLDLAPSVQFEKLRIFAANVVHPVPYPKHLSDESLKDERREWYREWVKTEQGQAFSDRNYVLMNSNVQATLEPNGEFSLKGVSSGPKLLRVVIPGQSVLAEVGFDGAAAKEDGLDLGTIRVGDEYEHGHSHDHDHSNSSSDAHKDAKGDAGNATASDAGSETGSDASHATDQQKLPRLRVKAVDADGEPLKGIDVLFYDRENYFSRQKLAFENINGVTDRTGIVDLGVMPHDWGCLEMSHPEKKFADCYTLIQTTISKCTQANPARANVQTEISDGVLTVTFTMTGHVDLEFKIVDDQTDEMVFWSEIFYRDAKTNRWWQIALVDGSQRQHNFLPIAPQVTKQTIRISAQGYETKTFKLPDDLDLTESIRREVRLKPMPEVEFKVMFPDGTPAAGTLLRYEYPDGLRSLQIPSKKTDESGIMTIQFPPSADLGTIRFDHPRGSAKMVMAELLEEASSQPTEVIRRSVSLKD